MRLIDMLCGFFWLCFLGKTDIDISGICDDSRKVKKGDVFICITGAWCDGHDYIGEAIDKGAAAIIVSRPDVFYRVYEAHHENIRGLTTDGQQKITWIWTQDTRFAEAWMAGRFYNGTVYLKKSGYPCIIGITGTKGKTTTSYMLKSIFEKAGYKVGLIGTVVIDTGKEVIQATQTTPSAIELHKYLRRMRHNHVDVVVMEVSSQGLKQHRIAGITLDAAVLTNIYEDHIGPNEHADMEEYIYCKSLIFKQSKIGFVNEDSSCAVEIAKQAACPVKYYSLKKLENMKENLKTNMPTEFNKENALAAATVAQHFDISKTCIHQGLLDVHVPGRMEILPYFKEFTVMIDYAHNATALENLLHAVHKMYNGKIICVFGCGGNRDKHWRIEMGEVSGRLADLTIVTNDNPRFEPPETIISQIEDGVLKAGRQYMIVPDRCEAIDTGISMARPGDIVILAGKGHENYQEIKGVKYPLDEHVYIKEKYSHCL